MGDNANINVVQLGDRFLSMTEAPISVQFDPRTLEAAGVPFKPPGVVTTAHPHLDRADGGMLNYAAKLGPRNEYRFFHLAPDSNEPEVIAGSRQAAGLRALVRAHRAPHRLRRVPLGSEPARAGALRPPVRRELPLGARARDALLPGRSRDRGGVGADLTDPFFAFHHLNSYEEADGTIVADIPAYADASIVERLYLDQLRAAARSRGRAAPLRIDPRRGTVEHERLIDAPFELGQINYRRCNERPYRYGWGVS